MSFSSISFAVFFVVVLLLLSITNLKRIQRLSRIKELRHIILLLASYFFYCYWDWKFCFLMLFLTIVAYLSARSMHQEKFRKAALITGITVPLIVLFVFKYYNFFVDSFCTAFGIRYAGGLSIILPVGISFYTFQSLSYIIDVYRGEIDAEIKLTNLALYISFFPQLVAGPIVKAKDFLPQLKENRNVNWKNLEVGLQIFIFGLFKKVVLADRLAIIVDEVYEAPAAFDYRTIILAVFSYSIQIYMDFSGYSDMAIGSAKCLGYDLRSNFNLPYISSNISEFWKRWHISLSSWLQQYLYIPLGGNRKGRLCTYRNLLLVMVLGGLWHGASWNFVIWGALHGAALCIYRIWSNMRNKKHNQSANNIAGCIFTFLFVSLCWIFFRIPDAADAFSVIKGIFTLQEGILHWYIWSFLAFSIVLAGTIAAYIKSKGKGTKINGFYPILDLSRFFNLVIWFVFTAITLGLAASGNSNPFIYFQF